MNKAAFLPISFAVWILSGVEASELAFETKSIERSGELNEPYSYYRLRVVKGTRASRIREFSLFLDNKRIELSAFHFEHLGGVDLESVRLSIGQTSDVLNDDTSVSGPYELLRVEFDYESPVCDGPARLLLEYDLLTNTRKYASKCR